MALGTEQLDTLTIGLTRPVWESIRRCCERHIVDGKLSSWRALADFLREHGDATTDAGLWVITNGLVNFMEVEYGGVIDRIPKPRECLVPVAGGMA